MEVEMELKDWLKKNNMNAREFSEQIQYQSAYIYRICAGNAVPGKKLSNIIGRYTNCEVTPKDLGYKEKEKCKCPTCGKLI